MELLGHDHPGAIFSLVFAYFSHDFSADGRTRSLCRVYREDTLSVREKVMEMADLNGWVPSRGSKPQFDQLLADGIGSHDPVLRDKRRDQLRWRDLHHLILRMG